MNEVNAPADVTLYTIPQSAKLLGVSRQTVYRYINEGLIPAVKIGGSRRLRLSDLRSFIAANVEGVEEDDF